MPAGSLSKLSRGATVVILRLRSLGDTVLMTPALALLKEHRPDLRLVVVLDRTLAGLLEGNREVSRILYFDRRRGLGGRIKMLGAIRSERPALCLNLHGGSASAWWTALSGARLRAGFDHFTGSFVYNVKIPRAQKILGRPSGEGVHTAEHHASAMFHLGVPVAPIPRACLAAAASPRKDPYAVLHVSAAYSTKQWPAARFLEAAEHIRSAWGLEPVAIAGPGEDGILDELPGLSRLRGLGLGKLKSLLAGANLFVGNDSGPAHVAAAFGVPSVLIFGSSDSRVWGPWRTPHVVIETDWDCKPCAGDGCRAFDEPRCILSVDAAPVTEAIDKLLSRALESGGAARESRPE